jgi:hypothetical protein
MTKLETLLSPGLAFQKKLLTQHLLYHCLTLRRLSFPAIAGTTLAIAKVTSQQKMAIKTPNAARRQGPLMTRGF